MAHLAEDPNDPDPDDTPLTAHQIRAKLAVTDSCQKKMQA